MIAELKQIEKEHIADEYNNGGVSYYFACDAVDMNISDLTNLKILLVKYKEIFESDNVILAKEEERVEDITNIIDEWHFNDNHRKKLIKLVTEADEYYKVSREGSEGDPWSECRLLEKDGVFVLLDFYLCD